MTPITPTVPTPPRRLAEVTRTRGQNLHPPHRDDGPFNIHHYRSATKPTVTTTTATATATTIAAVGSLRSRRRECRFPGKSERLEGPSKRELLLHRTLPGLYSLQRREPVGVAERRVTVEPERQPELALGRKWKDLGSY